MLGVQRLLFGRLRPSEIEQLYEKSWYAVTETCLAMTIFRDEVGGWFLVMFVSLLIGKVWGWIGEGRVEILEQQPPVDPRLFHVRVSVSLLLASLFEMLMFRYSVRTVLFQARPNMMVMFAFEFAVLTVTSLSTAARYLIGLHESSLIRNQISRRRAQLSQQLQITREATPAPGSPGGLSGLENLRETIDGTNDDYDVDVPGWEEKGRWLFYLDLMTGRILPTRIMPARSYTTPDFCKLILYLAFFSVLCMFYGMPIHIIRDVAITIRSFYKRMSDFIRYRQATKDMNTRYPDASADEIQREDVCIICREVMYASQRPYGAPDFQSEQTHLETNNHNRNRHKDSDGTTAAGNERFRPKKLPCGHILHYTCLRSWLERQQNCPICRAPVIVSTPNVSRSRSDSMVHDPRVQENQPHNNLQGRGRAPQPNVGGNTFNLGPFRLSFGVRPGLPRDLNDTNTSETQIPARLGAEVQQAHDCPDRLRQGSSVQEQVSNTISSSTIESQFLQLEQQLIRGIRSLGAHAAQLFLVRALEAELVRVRMGLLQEDLASMERLNPPQSVAIDLTQRSASRSEQQNIAASRQALSDGLIIPHEWNLSLLGRIKINGEISGTISSLSVFSGVAPESSDIHPTLFQTFVVGSQRERQQSRTPETESGIERRSSSPTVSNTFTGMSNFDPKNSNSKIHVVQLWNEKIVK